MYKILRSTSKVMAIFSVVGLALAGSVNADAREKAGAAGRTVAPAGVAVNEILGMEVWTNTGEEIASIDDVIVSHNGQVMDVVLDYEGELVAVPIQDLRFTSRDHVIYEGTRSDLDAARDHYVYGQGPYVYPRAYSGDRRGYYGADVRYGTGLRGDRDMNGSKEFVYSGPDARNEGYNAELRFGPGLPATEDKGYVSNDRGYYGDANTSEMGEHVYSGPDTGGEGYGDQGYGAELRFGPRTGEMERNRY